MLVILTTGDITYSTSHNMAEEVGGRQVFVDTSQRG